MPDKKVVSSSDIYEVYLGTFNDNKFTWYSVSKHKDLVDAYKAYKKYVNTQLKYTDEELKKVWDTGRLDVELRQGNKLLNWTGIYSRKVTELTREEEAEAQGKKKEKDKDKKKEKKDSINLPEDLVQLRDGDVDKVYVECDDGFGIEFSSDQDEADLFTAKLINNNSDKESIQRRLKFDELLEIYNTTVHR